jgi:hypothetical protein
VDWLTQTVVAPDDFEVGAIVTAAGTRLSVGELIWRTSFPHVGWGLAVPHTICMMTSRTT